MSRLALTRWLLATAAFLLLGWSVREHGLGSARIILGALLLLVFFYGGHGRPAPPGPPGPPEPS